MTCGSKGVHPPTGRSVKRPSKSWLVVGRCRKRLGAETAGETKGATMRERLIHWLKQRDQSQSYDWLDKWETCLVGEFLRDHQIKFSDFIATADYEHFKQLFREKPWIVGAKLRRLEHKEEIMKPVKG